MTFEAKTNYEQDETNNQQNGSIKIEGILK